MKMNKLHLVIILMSFTMLFSNCTGDHKDHNANTSTTIPKTNQRAIPKFDANNAYNLVAKQLDFGARVPGTDAHKNCKNWYVEQFKSLGTTVIEQNFKGTVYTGKTFDCTNVIAQVNPDKKERIVIATHWDSRPFADSDPDPKNHTKPVMAADDGASGPAVMLELAKQIQKNGIDIGVDFVLFDLEDYGKESGENVTREEAITNSETWAIGSKYWAQNLHRPDYKPIFGILLDMVGSKNAVFPYEGYSLQVVPVVTKKIWQLAKNMGKGNYFIAKEGGMITDDHINVIKYAKIPMLDIINMPNNDNRGFGDYHHTLADNMDIIDKRTLGAVGQVLLAVLYRQSNGNFL